MVVASSRTFIIGLQKGGRYLLKLSKVSCSSLELQKHERHSITAARK